MICNKFSEGSLHEVYSYRDRNRITFSSLKQASLEDYKSPTYSIKYVMSGTEHHIIDGKKLSVSKGNFLLVNNDHAAGFLINSKTVTTGLCIHLKKSLMKELYHDLLTTDENKLQGNKKDDDVPLIEEMIYSDFENNLGSFLRQMVQSFDVKTATIDFGEEELFFNLGRELILLQNNLPGARNLKTVRGSTRQELLRRLLIAKEIMDADFRQALDVQAISSASMLSASHLFRSFKKVFGVSPYQYISTKRLDHAATLISAKKYSITDIAYECGYVDLPTFSKAFRKKFGISPANF